MSFIDKLFRNRKVDCMQELKSILPEQISISGAVNAFEQMSRMPIQSPVDMLLFETGTFGFADEPRFTFSLVRQFQKDADDDEYQQLHLDIYYSPTQETEKYRDTLWSDDTPDFWQAVRSSAVFQFLNENNIPIRGFEVYQDRT